MGRLGIDAEEKCEGQSFDGAYPMPALVSPEPAWPTHFSTVSIELAPTPQLPLPIIGMLPLPLRPPGSSYCKVLVDFKSWCLN